MFEKIKRFYDLGLYTKEQVHDFVLKGVITKKQYNDIIGGKNEQ
ncbi:MAG: XkdX family protein [Clostridia bacterium]|nr:XkdX family protein [Clostridia bacterium]